MNAGRQTVPVALPGRAYDIVIGPGLLDDAGTLLAAHLARPLVFVITDRTVGALYGARLRAALAVRGIEAEILALAPGEATKGWGGLEAAVEWLIAARAERDDLVVALGGGVVGDLAGFAAAVLRRGVRFAQLPTSLLAQVDSSVGGKTGINSPRGKNLIGAFHQPVLVLADTALLADLPLREFRAGYAEVAKYGLLGDAAFFEWLETTGPGLSAGPAGDLVHAVRRSCEMKAEIVLEDEREAGRRALLNLGHTFGHALEAATGYSGRLLHGEGVALGLCLAATLSARLGHLGQEVPGRIAAHLDAMGLPTRLDQIPGDLPEPEALMGLMAQDKKVKDGTPTFILMSDIGAAFASRAVPADALREVLCEAAGA